MNDTTPVTIALVDDHALIRQAMHFRLSLSGYKIILEADNGQLLLDQLSDSLLPDVCLLDINMPVMDGFETAQRIKENWPSVKILFFSMHNTNAFITRATQVGADGFIAKDAPFEELNKTILKILDR